MSFLANLWLGLSVVTLAAIGLSCLRHPQHMEVMNITWPLTALYFGPVAWPLYAAFGRAAGHDHAHHHSDMHHTGGHAAPVSLRSTFVSTTHCGGGCALGDVVGETVAALGGVMLFGSLTLGAWGLDLALAYLAGILFQYFSIKPMAPEMTPRDALLAAVKADTLSILTFEVGMFVVMGLRTVVAPGLSIGDGLFCIWMQAAMVAGFATSMPANWLLVRIGLKHAM